MNSPVAQVVDWTAVGVVVATWVGWLSPLATVLPLVWFSMQIVSWVVNKGWLRK